MYGAPSSGSSLNVDKRPSLGAFLFLIYVYISEIALNMDKKGYLTPILGSYRMSQS